MVKLIDAPVGVFRCGESFVLKTEYSREFGGRFVPDCYLLTSGEYFYGGTDNAEDFLNLSVEPMEFKETRIGHWVYDPNGMDWNLPAWVCSECRHKNDLIPTHIRGREGMIQVENPYHWAGSQYCPCCGVKMAPTHPHAEHFK